MISDFGVNKGGGDFVFLNILETLSKKYDVTLITSTPSGFYETSNLFNKEISGVNVLKVKPKPFLHHPYTIAYMAKKVAKKDSYDLFILPDDVPSCLIDRKVLCYIHYPHAARLKFKDHLIRKYKKTLSGKIEWRIHQTIFPFFYPVQKISDKWLLVVNSMVTMEHTIKTFNLNPERVILLNPPVASASIKMIKENSHLQKEDLVVCIGWFEPLKGISDAVRALSLIKDEYRPRLRLIGFKGDDTYLNELIKSIDILGVKDKVELFLDAERDTLLHSLLKAKVIVHSAPHEHFGIAVVEGMAAGCIPIVRKGFNGPWMEILREGRYGFGFDTVEELAFTIEKTVRSYGDFDTEKITLRALESDEKHFRDKFLEIVDHFLNQLD